MSQGTKVEKTFDELKDAILTIYKYRESTKKAWRLCWIADSADPGLFKVLSKVFRIYSIVLLFKTKVSTYYLNK